MKFLFSYVHYLFFYSTIVCQVGYRLSLKTCEACDEFYFMWSYDTLERFMVVETFVPSCDDCY